MNSRWVRRVRALEAVRARREQHIRRSSLDLNALSDGELEELERIACRLDGMGGNDDWDAELSIRERTWLDSIVTKAGGGAAYESERP